MQRLRENPLTSNNLEAYVSEINCIRGQSIILNPGELPERIVAIGDIHGDLEALFSILLKSGIIDEHGRWIAVNTFLVQTGDIFDKGRLKPPIKSVGQPQNSPGYMRSTVPYDVIDKYGNAQTVTGNHNFDFGEVGDELVILKFLTDLHVQASESDGKFGNSRVLLCTGNHEFMNTSQYDYFSDTPDDEVQRIIVEGTQQEIQSEIDKRQLKNEHGQPLRLSAFTPVEQQRRLLSAYMGINNVTSQQYSHPMDAVLFGGPDFPIRREIFRHGRGYLARKLACILNAVVVVGDFIFSHGGINSVNLNTINDIGELQLINDTLRDYLLGNPTNPNDIEKYFINGNTSILWNRNLGKENAPDRFVCQDTIELIRDKLHRPNLNIVIGHDIQGTCIDPRADADLSIPRVRNAYNRHNPDGTIDRCITLPTTWCNNQIYRIDTGISRMTNSADYRTPNEGNLNSLIIELNSDGSKHSVNAMNGILGLQVPIKKD
jgi:hypothetical protein